MSPSSDSVTRHPPSLHRIASGRLLRLLWYYGDAPRPCRLSHQASSSARQYHPMRFHFAPSGREALPPAGQELLFLRCPRPETQDGDDWASQVPGRPPCPHALLLDPGGTSAPGHLRRLSVAFRLSATASASTTAPISGLNHTAYELAVYASCATLAADHARLASGCWPTFAGRECLPAGSRKKVSKMSSTFDISSSFSRLNLAHRAAGAERGEGPGERPSPHPGEPLAGAPAGPERAEATDRGRIRPSRSPVRPQAQIPRRRGATAS